MAQKITDPVTFLKNLVSRKGRSDREGVYLTGVNVAADGSTDYDYDVCPIKIESNIDNLWAREENLWNSLLVNIRRRPEELSHSITFSHSGEDVTVYYLTEDHDASALVFIPKLEVSDFVYEVTFHQRLLQRVAEFAGKTPNTLKFILGAAFLSWDEMVDEGYAQEVDVGF